MPENGDLRPLSLNLGERIVFGKYAGTEVAITGDKLLILREEHVLGVIEA